MTNLETTDQFKAANKRWSKEKNKESGPSMTVTAHSRGLAMMASIDADGDIVKAPTHSSGGSHNESGDRKNSGGKRRAKWVDATERDKRREKGPCFRCGGSGHRIRERPYAPPMQPPEINAVSAKPLLEDDGIDTEPVALKWEKSNSRS
jgi:hypothetical protein